MPDIVPCAPPALLLPVAGEVGYLASLVRLRPTDPLVVLEVKGLPADLESGGTPIEGEFPKAEPGRAWVTLQGRRVEIVVGRAAVSVPVPRRRRPTPRLEYVLFGTMERTFLLHVTQDQNDFGQLVQVELERGQLSPELLAASVRVAIAGRANTHADRLRSGSATGHLLGTRRGVVFSVVREWLR